MRGIAPCETIENELREGEVFNRKMESVQERMERLGTKEKIATFMQKEKQPYEFKRKYAQIRAEEFASECEGQISLFEVFDGKILNEICHTKPAVGKNLIFHYKGKDYPCVVDKHCGYDFFHIEFTDRQPSDDFPEVEKNTGWHVSLRGYKRDWDFPEVMP